MTDIAGAGPDDTSEAASTEAASAKAMRANEVQTGSSDDDTVTKLVAAAIDPVGAATDAVTQAAQQAAQQMTDAAGQAYADWCKANPSLCKAIDPDSSLCQRLQFPDAVCDKDGLKDWFLWALGLTGAVMLGGVVYASYRAARFAAPIALGVYAPEAMPLYQALQKGDTEAQQQHIVKLVQDRMATTPRTGP